MEKKLTENQLKYLRLISGFHALTLKTISNELDKNESSARSTLKRLEEKGYIKYSKVPPGKYGTLMFWITKKTERLFK